jgi:acyl dehydratase
MTTTVHIDDLARIRGRDLGSSPWFEVSQWRIDTFAEATGDNQWIHVDVPRAKEGPFGAPIAHGYLTLALFIPMFGALLEVEGANAKVNYGLNLVRFPAPVPAGSRVRLRAKVDGIDQVARDGVQVTIGGTIEIEGAAKPVCVLQNICRFYR